MKKQRDTIIITLCILFTVFLCGIFIGRASSRYPVALNYNADKSYADNASNSNDLFIGKKMNINVATAEDLMLIPSIGEATAQKIIAYREKHGAFQSLSDLGNVDGLSANHILELVEYITIGGTYEDTGR